ncbi:MAG: class I poly(R)-hydroxyalkanoic acid synthase, partial [Pseudomonadota bacterium]
MVEQTPQAPSDRSKADIRKPKTTKKKAARVRAASPKNQGNPAKKPSSTPPDAASTAPKDKKPDAPIYTDMARFAEYMADINVRTKDIMNEVAERHAALGRRGATQPADPLNAAEAGTEVAQALTSNPLRLMQMQLGLWENYTKLFSATMERMSGTENEPVAIPRAGDRRFAHKAWEENPMLDFVKQSYLLFSDWVNKTIEQADGVDEATKRRAFFHADQLLSAMSPSNVPALNPEVLDETINTQGANWLAGLQNFM